MIRNILLAVAGIATAILLAPTSQAAPKLCDQHGTGQGQIYIHACATGGGGGAGVWTATTPAERAARLAQIHDGLQRAYDRLGVVGP